MRLSMHFEAVPIEQRHLYQTPCLQCQHRADLDHFNWYYRVYSAAPTKSLIILQRGPLTTSPCGRVERHHLQSTLWKSGELFCQLIYGTWWHSQSRTDCVASPSETARSPNGSTTHMPPSSPLDAESTESASLVRGTFSGAVQ